MTEILTRHETGLDVGPLRNLLDGDVVAPGEVEWDEARHAWNLTVDQSPAAVVLPESTADVAATLAFAKAHGLRVAPQGTGHGATALGSLKLSSWDDDFVSTFKVANYQVAPGVSCP